MLAVKFYAQIPIDQKPAGIPDMWPAECIELHNNESSFDGTWTILTKSEYDAYKLDNQALYNAWYASYTTPTPDQVAAAQLAYVKSRISAARTYGIGIVTTYGAVNVLAGLNTEQVQRVMSITSKVVAALNTGSLYVALAELAMITPDETIIKTSQITQVRNQIQDYLGIPRT